MDFSLTKLGYYHSTLHRGLLPVDFCLCHREAAERGKVSVHRVLPIFQLI